MARCQPNVDGSSLLRLFLLGTPSNMLRKPDTLVSDPLLCNCNITKSLKPFADQILVATVLDWLPDFSTSINIGGQGYRWRERRKAGVFRELAETPKKG